MNKRIRKKHLAECDQLIADGLSLYARRPRGDAWEALAADLLALDVGLALYFRLQILGGPRRGWGVGPPTQLIVEQLTTHTIRARGTVEYLPPNAAAAPVTETVYLRAQLTPRGWRASVFTSAPQPEIALAAV